MVKEIVPITTKVLERAEDEIFSKYTHPVLEDFIQKVIEQNKEALSSVDSQKLVREFFLYGFLRASGQDFLYGREREREEPAKNKGFFETNNGVLAVSDFDREVYIRGGDSYHGYFSSSGEEPQGVEGTLLNLGYKSGGIYVPHSNRDIFADERREKLFGVLHYFSKMVRELRGEPTSGLIIKDLSEPEPSAPYQRRDPKLPRIVLQETILIPGNRNKIIEIAKPNSF